MTTAQIADGLTLLSLVMLAYPFLRKWRHIRAAVEWQRTIAHLDRQTKGNANGLLLASLRNLHDQMLSHLAAFNLGDITITLAALALQAIAIILKAPF